MTSLVNRLDKRAVVFRPPGPDDLDDWGQQTENWVEVVKIWAAIEPLRGQDRAAAAQVTADVTTRIRIRYREGVDRTMVVRYKGIEFEILYIIHPTLGMQELQLMCKERQ